jgi:hypothetical protein
MTACAVLTGIAGVYAGCVRNRGTPTTVCGPDSPRSPPDAHGILAAKGESDVDVLRRGPGARLIPPFLFN